MKRRLAKFGRGLLAAATSTEAVKQERSLAALIIGRALLAAGASDGVYRLVTQLIHG